jgi:hypothetical protein
MFFRDWNRFLEPVLEPLKTQVFVGFQEPVLDGTLNLKKGFQNRFLRTLNFKNGSRTGSLEPYKFVRRVSEPVPWKPKF